MIYVDDKGQKHVVKLLGRNGPWAYVELPDGTAVNVHSSTLKEEGTRPKPPRYIPNPEPYRTPKTSREPKP